MSASLSLHPLSAGMGLSWWVATQQPRHPHASQERAQRQGARHGWSPIFLHHLPLLAVSVTGFCYLCSSLQRGASGEAAKATGMLSDSNLVWFGNGTGTEVQFTGLTDLLHLVVVNIFCETLEDGLSYGDKVFLCIVYLFSFQSKHLPCQSFDMLDKVRLLSLPHLLQFTAKY